MNTTPADGDQPKDPETPVTPETPEIPERISFTSVPVLMTGVVLSAVLLLGALWWWGALGKEIRDQVSWSQGGVWLFIVLLMVAFMLSIGYSRLWAEPGRVTVRNGPFLKRYGIDQIAGLRLRKGDPWAYLLLKNQGKIKPVAVLAIQAAEGNTARKKVNRLRAWLKANGATSRDVRAD